MRKQLLLAVLAWHFSLVWAEAQPASSRVEYQMLNDFETGELFGWEPFPYAQDIGFDALYFTRRSPTYKNSRYALARPLKAHDTNELYQGFTKRLDFYTTNSTRIKAAVYFQSDRNPASLEVSLGTFDGRRFFHRIDAPVANQWLELDIPLDAFTAQNVSLKPGEHIQVITLKGTYPVVNYLFTYTILMDDFQINGQRDRRFVSSNPVSTDFDMFGVSILNRHYFYKDVISLKISSEDNEMPGSVSGTLVNSQGKIVKDNIQFKRDGNSWVNSAIYKLTAKDLPGQWKIKLVGKDGRGEEIRSEFRFLMPGNKVTEHPRLFFSAAELKDRIAKEKSVAAKRILEKALQKTSFMNVNLDSIREGKDYTAENLVGGPYAKNSVGFKAYSEWNEPNSILERVITDGSFRYAFTGDRASGEKAKEALIKLCSFNKWNSNWMLERKFWTYYPVGYTIKAVAYGYDMLFDILSDKERSFVRAAIMDKGLRLFHRDMVEMNRMPSNQTNHIAVMVAGFGLAATAIYGDDPDNPYLEPYLSGIMTKAKTFIDRTYYEDGSYGEPKSGYMDMATRDIVEVMAAFERNFGVDYSTTTNVENFYKYPLQAMDSNRLIQSYGDGGRVYNGFTQDHAMWFVNRTGNPYLYQYVKPYWEAGNGGYLGYLWFRDDLKPSSREELPLSKKFAAQGMVMRSGWGDASTIITTRVGPNSNHYHYDQGSFQVMTNGEELLTDPGVGALGYYANLDFLRYNIHAIAHNVMLVDHDPESQAPAHYDNGIKALRTWPVIEHDFTGTVTDAVESDLRTVYKDKLARYSRTLLYTKSGPLFVFDQVKSNSSEGHVYDWLFHVPQNKDGARCVNYKNQRMTVTRPKARLTMDVITPEIASFSIRDRNDNKFPESFLTLESKPALTEANFFAVIFPEAKPATGDYGVMPKSTRVDAKGWIGARVEHESGTYLGFFRTDNEASETAGGFSTDAKRFTASFNRSENLVNAYFEGSAFSGPGIALKASNPITCAIILTSETRVLELNGQTPATIIIDHQEKPESLLMNAKAFRGWNYDPNAKKLTLEVPAGRNDITIKL